MPEKSKKENCCFECTFKAGEHYFDQQLSLLKKLVNILIGEKKPTRANYLWTLLFNTGSSGAATLLLSQKGLYNESIIISRCFLERAINFTYLLVCDEEEYENFIDYSKQKVIRSLYTKQRAYKHIKLEIPLPKDPLSFHHFSAELKKFSGEKGGEKKRWTSLNLEERVAFVEKKINDFNKKSGALFKMAIAYLYEDASEAIHGTLYGGLFHMGVIFGKTESAKMDEHAKGILLHVFMLSGGMIHGILHVVSKEKSIEELIRQSERNEKVLLEAFAG